MSRDNPARPCEVPDCDRGHYGLGYCSKHYQRFKKYGTTDDPRPTDEQRFWEKVDASGECWVWLGGRNRREGGYPTFRHDGRQGYAHRFSYELHLGPIPDGTEVCHHCDNPPCVNPAHLFLGTRQDNVDDQVRKWRVPIGSADPHARLTERAVEELRRRYAAGGVSMRVLAAERGVSLRAVKAAVSRETWKHVA